MKGSVIFMYEYAGGVIEAAESENRICNTRSVRRISNISAPIQTMWEGRKDGPEETRGRDEDDSLQNTASIFVRPAV